MDLNIKINKNNVFNFFTNNLEKIYNIYVCKKNIFIA